MQNVSRLLLLLLLTLITTTAFSQLNYREFYENVVSFSSTGAIKVPIGSTAERPSAEEGMVRANSDANSFEGYINGAWGAIGGGGDTSNLLEGNNSNFNGSLGEWTTYNDEVGGVYDFVDGTGGTPGMTCTASTTNPLEGNASLFCIAVSNAGNGISTDWVMPDYLRGKSVEQCFTTRNTSTAGGSWQYVVYDVDTTTILLQEDIPEITVDTPEYICSRFTAHATSVNYRTAYHLTSNTPIAPQTQFDVVTIENEKTINVDQSAFVGSLKWTPTTDCQWVNTTSAYSVFGDDTECDDNSRIENGLEDSSNGLAPNFTIPNARAGVTYKIKYSGHFIKGGTANAACWFRLSYDSTTSNRVAGANSAESSVGVQGVSFDEIRFSSAGSKEVQLQISSSDNTTSCYIDVRNVDLLITVYAYPDEKATVFGQNSTLSKESDNDFSSSFTGSAGVTPVAVSTEKYAGAITCTRSAAGTYPCSIVLDTALAVVPVVQCTPSTLNKTCEVVSKTTTSFEVRTRNAGATTLTDSDFEVTVERQGADINKMIRLNGTQYASQIISEVYRYTSDSGAALATTSTKFNYEDFDSTTSRGPGITNTSGTYTGFKTGRWEISASISANTGTFAVGDLILIGIFKNSTRVGMGFRRIESTNGSSRHLRAPTITYLTPSDSIEIRIFKDGTAVNSVPTTESNELTFKYIGQ